MTQQDRPRVLIVTPLDYRKMLNNVEHHRADHYTRLGCSVTVLHKVLNQSARLRDMLWDTVSFRAREDSFGEVRAVGVDPFFNYFGGLRKNAEERPSDGARGSMFKLALIRLLSPLSVLRDVFVVPCFLLAGGLKIRRRQDVCVGIGPWGVAVGLILRALGRVSFVVYGDHDYEPGLVPDRLRQSYTGALERFCARRADLVVSVGNLLAELRRRHTDREVVVIPNGVDWDDFAEARRPREPGRTLIYLGNVISWSGIEHVLQALPQVREMFPGTTLRIVGDGLPGYLERLHRMVDELGLHEAVEFVGHRPPEDLAGLLSTADVGLANSEPVSFRRYACPLKIMEYMAAGLPVVATAGTEGADIVARADAGLSLPYDVDALVESLALLLGDAERYEEMRSNGIEYSRRVDWHTLIGKELELIAARAGWKSAGETVQEVRR